MGVTVDWYDEQQTIVHYRFVEKWNWDEFFKCWAWVEQTLNSSDHPVSGLMDLSASNTIPADALVRMRGVMQRVHPNFSGATAFVGTGSLGKVYYNLVTRLYPGLLDEFQFFFVESVEEAVQQINAWVSKKGTP